MPRFRRCGNSWADAPRRSSLRGVEGCSVIRIGEHPAPAVPGAWLASPSRLCGDSTKPFSAPTSASPKTAEGARQSRRCERRTSGSGAALAMPGRPIDPYAFVSIGGSGNRDQDSPHSNLNRRRVLASCAVVRPDPLALEWATALALRSLPCPRKAAPCARFRSPCWVRRDRRRRVDQPPHAFHAPMETRSRCPGPRLSTCCWPMVV